MRASFLCAVLLVTMFAGCVEDAEPTARSWLSRATAEAREWDEEAYLVGIEAAEVGPAAEADDEGEIGYAQDDEVGDGVTTQWLYHFAAPDRDVDLLVVVSDGGIEAIEDEADDEEPVDVDVWQIDSDEAARLAKQGSPMYANLTGHDDSLAAYTLRMHEGGLVWGLVAMRTGFNETMVIVLVDAVDGETQEIDFEQFFKLNLAGAEFGTESGQLTAAVPQAAFEFQLEEEHGTLAFVLSADEIVPLATINATITLPDGTEVTLEATSGPAGEPGELVIEDVGPGIHAARLALTGPASTWQLEWCTSGLSFGPTNDACRLA